MDLSDVEAALKSLPHLLVFTVRTLLKQDGFVICWKWLHTIGDTIASKNWFATQHSFDVQIFDCLDWYIVRDCDVPDLFVGQITKSLHVWAMIRC